MVRVEQGGVFGTSGAEEARVMRSLHAIGFPVARIVASEPSGTVIGQPFFVMAYLDVGAAPEDERAIDDRTAAAFVSTMHRLHQIELSGIEFDIVPPTPSHATPMQVERWRSVYRSATATPIPLLEEAAAWLVHHAPPLDRLSVVHGDAGPGNFVHDAGRVVGADRLRVRAPRRSRPRTGRSACRCAGRGRCRGSGGWRCSPSTPASR